jgi:ferric-dicitrate binding protein FerR (iron transport regulator)
MRGRARLRGIELARIGLARFGLAGGLLCALAAPHAFAQRVISARAGYVGEMEGYVVLPMGTDRKPARQLADGQSVSTGSSGQAQLVLTPASYLRVENNSAARMVSTALTAPVVELLAGSHILQVAFPPRTIRTPITVLWRGQSIPVTHEGRYRFALNSRTMRVYVLDGRVNGRLRLPGSTGDLKSGRYQEISASGTVGKPKKIGARDPPARVAFVTYMEGRVQLPAENGVHPIRRLGDDYRVATEADGRVEVALTSGAFLRLDRDSEVRMVSVRPSAFVVELLRGTASIQVIPKAVQPPITLIWRGQRIAVTHHGLYRLELKPDWVRAYVMEGKLRLPGGSNDLKKSQYADFSPARVLSAAAKFSRKYSDDFDRFTSSRARAVTPRARIPFPLFPAIAPPSDRVQVTINPIP